MKGDFDELTTGAQYYDLRADRTLEASVALANEVYFIDVELDRRVRLDRDDVEDRLGDDLIHVDETTEVIA